MKKPESPMPGDALRIERPTTTLRQLALDKLRGAIMQFHFAPGERLTERRLCEELGVSRTVVREVLRHLETEGLVETTLHRGPAVAVLDPAIIEQIYELRMSLEAIAARACALAADDEVVSRLEASLDAIEAAYARGEANVVLDETTMFYETMFLTGGKTLAWDIERNLNARITALRALTISAAGRSRTGPAEMRRIVDAIRSRDAGAAEVASRSHVERALDVARQRLSEVKPSQAGTGSAGEYVRGGSSADR
jgi:DNA-binding GntR family transcriptional regulator